MYNRKSKTERKEFAPKKPPVKAHEERSFDFTNALELRRYLTVTGRIKPRRYTGLSAKSQLQLARAIKRARIMGLLPFVVRPKTSFR